MHLNGEGIHCGVVGTHGLTAVVVVVKVDCTYFVAGGWFKGTTSVTSWYTRGLKDSYLEGCNFLTATVSTAANSLTHSLLLV
jgi:hypothetical protein